MRALYGALWAEAIDGHTDTDPDVIRLAAIVTHEFAKEAEIARLKAEHRCPTARA